MTIQRNPFPHIPPPPCGCGELWFGERLTCDLPYNSVASRICIFCGGRLPLCSLDSKSKGPPVAL